MWFAQLVDHLNGGRARLVPGVCIDCAVGFDCAFGVENRPANPRRQLNLNAVSTLDAPRSGIISSISENSARVGALGRRTADRSRRGKRQTRKR